METSTVQTVGCKPIEMNKCIFDPVLLLDALCVTAAPVEEQDANGVGTCPISSAVTEQSAENPLDSASLLSGGALEEPQNENNNHPCKASLKW